MASFVKIGVLKSMRHISAQMNFYPYFPHICVKFSRRQFHLYCSSEVLWKPAQETPYFYDGLKMRIHFSVCRETAWHFESNEHLDNVCLLRQGVCHSYFFPLYPLLRLIFMKEEWYEPNLH